MVLFPDDNDLQLLTTQAEQQALLAQYGVNHLVVIPFSKEFARQSALEFVQNVLVNQLGTKTLVIGYDHHFGRNREGNINSLRQIAPQFGFDVVEIPPMDIDDINISSTKIRNALLGGDIATANTYLGYPYTLSGTVVEGNKLGRTIGYPTANISVGDKYKLIPQNGVYAVKATVGGQTYGAMMNIGIRPTVNGTTRTIEANIFDFDADIYGQTLTLHFVSRIRAEQKFDGLDALKAQLAADKQIALQLLQTTAWNVL